MGLASVVRLALEKSHFSPKVRELYFLLPVLVGVLVSLFLSELVLLSEPFGNDYLFSLFGHGETALPQILLLAAVAIPLTLILVLRRLSARREFAVRILTCAVLVGGGVSTLFFGKLAFFLSGSEYELLLVAVAGAAFVEMFSGFLILIGALSHENKNKLFVVSSGALGAFLGVLLPTFSVIIFSIILAIADTILVFTDSAKRLLGEENYEELITEMAFSTEEWGIGVGDLICYSIIASNTFVNFGTMTTGATVALILLGSLLTMKLATKRNRFPGLPIVTILSLLPSIILSVFS